jgi:uncharacterized protein
MPAGLTSKLNILQQSPHDLEPAEPEGPSPAEVDSEAVRWVPSRYNIRAATDDGRLVLWNSYKRSMSIFGAAQRLAIEAMLSKKGFSARPKGMVKYLFDRGYLLKEGTDEYRRIQLAFGQQQYRTDTLQFTLLASEDCNLRCQYCYEEFARGTMHPQVRTGIKNLVEKRLSGLKSLSVSWFGGEPLYGFQAIEDLGPFFIEMSEKHSLRFSSGMTTNGYLLTPEIADKLLAWKIDSFQITIDGTPEDHDRSRPTRDGQGTFSTIFDNLRAMHRRPQSEDFEIDIRVNWDLRNYPHLGGFLDLIEAEFRGDPRFKVRFHSVFPSGGPNDAQLAICGMDEAVQLQKDLEREARKRGLTLAEDLRQVKPVSSGVCYAARPYHFVIGATGKVMKCTIELDMADRNVVGFLSEEGELTLDQDKMALWCEPAFEKDTKCQKCVVLPVCMGSSCPLIRFERHTSPCIPLRQTAKHELRAMAELDTVEPSRRAQSEGRATSQSTPQP